MRSVFQISHVDECHAARTVTEYEEVSCKEQGRVAGQVEPLQLEDGLFADCPFGGRGDAGIDLGERVGLFGQFFAYGLVVGGAQDAHVERAAVAPDVALGQPLLVPADESGGVVGCGDQFAFLRVPPVGEDPHGGGNLFVFLSVAKLVADRSCFPVDRRRAEFYFDCCHTILFLGFTLRS